MSPKFWEVLRHDSKEKRHDPSEWQDIIFKEDLKKASVNFEKHCEDPTYSYDPTVRYRHKDGSTVWIRCRGIAIREQNGKAKECLGTIKILQILKKKRLL